MNWTIPNLLTVTRLILAPFLGIVLVVSSSNAWAVTILILFILAAITDYLDGYLARVLNQSSSLGKLMDPIADKAMVIILLCFINFDFTNQVLKIFVGIPTVLIVFREVFISGLREFMAHGSEVINVTKLSKWKTASQLIAIGVLLSSKVSYLTFLPLTEIGIGILWIASLITLLSGFGYFLKALPVLKRSKI